MYYYYPKIDRITDPNRLVLFQSSVMNLIIHSSMKAH